MFGEEGGDEGVDDRFAAAGEVGLGATIMGRNMFGPIRGDWPDNSWQGWWGDDPPYTTTHFLTHHPRESVTMEGGTSSTSSPTGLKQPWSGLSLRPTGKTYGWPAASLRFSSISKPAWSMRCIWRMRRAAR